MLWFECVNEKRVAAGRTNGASHVRVGAQDMHSPVGNGIQIQVLDAEGNIELLSELSKGCGIASEVMTVAISPIVDDSGNALEGDGDFCGVVIHGTVKGGVVQRCSDGRESGQENKRTGGYK